MHLDLIHNRDDLDVWKENVQVLLTEVGDTNALHLACEDTRFSGCVRLFH